MTSSPLERSNRDGPLADLGMALFGALLGVALTMLIGNALADDSSHERAVNGSVAGSTEPLLVSGTPLEDSQALNELYLAALERLSNPQRSALPPTDLTAMFDAAAARATATKHSVLPDPELDVLYRTHF